MVKWFVADNISEASIINKKLIKDHMFADKLTAVAIHVTKEIHNEYKSASNKYEIQKEEAKRKNSQISLIFIILVEVLILILSLLLCI